MAQDLGSMSPAQLTDLYRLEDADLARVREIGRLVVPKLDSYVARFYEWLETQPEFEELFHSEEQLQRVRRQQVEYWTQFFGGSVDDAYVRSRKTVGGVHARIGLSLQAYFAAMNLCMDMYAESIASLDLSESERSACAASLAKQIHLDTSIVVDTFSRLTNETIAEQSRALIAMSTPVTAIWQGILLLPIVGVVDSKRAQDIMNGMLVKISETRARVIILDIGGVAVVDTAVANHLIKITKATRLMGCQCTISGVSPAVAQTVVELGIDVGEVKTTATLRDALEQAFIQVGVRIERGA